jgi:septal ring factor EnvC (AmiA/AmiB activator)
MGNAARAGSRAWWLTVLLLGAALDLGSAPLRAQDAEEAARTRAKIEQLEKDIAKITRQQRERQQQKNALQAELRDSEVALGRLQQEQEANRSAIDENRAEIARLADEQNKLRAASQRQQAAVAEEVRQAWKSGGNDQLRLLLSEDDPQLLARMLAYYRYLLAARSALLDEYRDTLTALATVEDDLRGREAQLETQLASLNERQRELESTRSKRQTVLAQIESALSSDSAELAARQQDREELEVLLTKIDAALAQLIPEEDVEPFSAARGSMRWPVNGRITDSFGRPRNQGKMRWQGVRLKAEAGSTVAAIHHGRVVYADWLRGSGLLIVIDHGEGYMSLYAHNESLLREVGDWVNAGSPIATVGDSGGQSEPGLYFEIRKNGKPTDPKGWCRG